MQWKKEAEMRGPKDAYRMIATPLNKIEDASYKALKRFGCQLQFPKPPVT